jgi:phosphoenolpyruvate-protein kinase (PTS system EI component)
MIPFLLGIGIRQYSVESRLIPGVHNLLGGLDTRACRDMADRLLKLGRIPEVEAALGDA